jgi:hypothetical protein
LRIFVIKYKPMEIFKLVLGVVDKLEEYQQERIGPNGIA